MSTYDDASLIYYPSGYKESKAYSLKPTDGSGDLTFTRASTATRVNEQGLIEGVRTNLLTYSEQFDNAAWVKNNSSVTANVTTAPNGTTTADKLIPNATASVNKYIRQVPSATNGLIYSLTVFAKAAEYDMLRIEDGNNSRGAWFNLSLGTVGSVSLDVSTNIEALENGWYKCTISKLSAASSVFFLIGGSNTESVQVGDGTSGIYIWGAMLEQSVQATEYIPTTTTAVSVGMLANVPRIDYTGGGCGKLLLEPQRTNLIKNSANVGAGFVVGNITLVLNNAAAPNGLVEADKFYPNTSGSYRWFYQAVTTSASCTISVFAKADGKDILYISEGSLADVSFDLSSGLVIFERSGWVGSIEDFGDGWYRCIAVKSSSVSFAAYGVADIGGSNTVTASGTDGILVWGMQCESSATYPTSYIPTSGTAVTRVADSASKTGISALIGQTEGTFFVDFEYNSTKPETTYFSIDDVAGNNRILIYGVTTPKINCLIQVGGSTQAVFSFDPSANTRYKIAVGYKVNDFTAYVNGSQIGSDLSGSVTWTAPLSRFTFNAVVQYNAQKINSAIIIPTRLSNAELATLTTL